MEEEAEIILEEYFITFFFDEMKKKIKVYLYWR